MNFRLPALSVTATFFSAFVAGAINQALGAPTEFDSPIPHLSNSSQTGTGAEEKTIIIVVSAVALTLAAACGARWCCALFTRASNSCNDVPHSAENETCGEEGGDCVSPIPEGCVQEYCNPCHETQEDRTERTAERTALVQKQPRLK